MDHGEHNPIPANGSETQGPSGAPGQDSPAQPVLPRLRGHPRFVEREAWQVQGIEVALGQAEDGEGLEHERVDAWLMSWGSASESEPPR